jgi:CarD family transcriptional regulator
MFSIGDVVSYGSAGVCRIDGECEQKVKGEKKKYLVLKPVHRTNSTVYVPMDNETLMGRLKSLLTFEEVEELIEAMPDENTAWISDDSERTEKFKEIIKGSDRLALVRMVRMLYLRRQEQTAKGRKLRSSDEYFLKDAESKLFDEFSVVLGIKPEDVVEFIGKKLGTLDNKAIV